MGVNAPVLFDFHVVYAAELKLRAAAQILFHIAALELRACADPTGGREEIRQWNCLKCFHLVLALFVLIGLEVTQIVAVFTINKKIGIGPF